jgi:ABC-2 type transport system permease protein
MVNGILTKTIFSNVPQLLGQSLQARAKSFIGDRKLDAFNRSLAENIARAFNQNPDETLKSIEAGNFGLDRLAASSAPAGGKTTGGEDFLSKIARIDSEQVAGKDVKSPAATRVVGGFAIQFLLFALSSSATALFYERDRGIFHRVLAAPVTRSHILWSKFVYGAALGLLQLLVLFISGRILFGIDIEHHLGLLVVICVFAAGACTSFGMLLASISSSMEAASGLGTFLILVMCAVGGAWFPVSFMPQIIQLLAKFTIVYWSMEGFSQVLWADASLGELLPTIGILVGITAAVMALAVWRFNRGRIFE